MTIYEAFLRPLGNYGDIIYGQPQNKTQFNDVKQISEQETTV